MEQNEKKQSITKLIFGMSKENKKEAENKGTPKWAIGCVCCINQNEFKTRTN